MIKFVKCPHCGNQQKIEIDATLEKFDQNESEILQKECFKIFKRIEKLQYKHYFEDLPNFLVVTPDYKKAAEYFTFEKTTIKTHVDRLFSKFQVNSLAELVAVYFRYNSLKSNNIDIFNDLHIKYINEIDRHKTEIAKLEQKIEVLGELQGEVNNANRI